MASTMPGAAMVHEQQSLVPQPQPRPAQLAFQRPGISLFAHFGPCTFLGCQWNRDPLGVGNASVFNPTALDTDSWFQAAADLGADEV